MTADLATADAATAGQGTGTQIKDRIYGPYFTAQAVVPAVALPKITKVVFTNALSIPLLVYVSAPAPSDTGDSFAEDGDWFHPDSPYQQLENMLNKGSLAPGATVTISDAPHVQLFPNAQVKVLSAATRGVLGFWTASPSSVAADGTLTIALDETLMRAPNGIGEPPAPKDGAPVPRDSPKLVVGFGNLPGTPNYLIRQQYWRKSTASYSLAAGESKTIIYNVASGMTSASATTEQISASMTSSASAGFGGISAGVSLALSGEHRAEGAQTISSETYVEFMDQLDNSGPGPLTVIVWELVDLYSVCNGTSVLNSFEFTQSPPIVRDYPAKAIPPAPPAPSISGGSNTANSTITLTQIHLPTSDINFMSVDPSSGAEHYLATLSAGNPSRTQYGEIAFAWAKLPVLDGQTVRLRHAKTGGLIGDTTARVVPTLGNDTLITFEMSNLHHVNEIGLPPRPTGDVLLPQNSGTIVVGFGQLVPAAAQQAQYGTVLYTVHEQYWRRTPQSYSLSVGQKKTITVTQVSGVTMTTSTMESLSAMVGATASGSWGPFSASLSLSLSYSSSQTETQTLTRETTSVIESVVSNPTKDAVTVFIWELVDLYHLYSDKVHLMVESVQGPTLVMSVG